MTCATCIHWNRKGGSDAKTHPHDAKGDCRRHPPRIVDSQLSRTQRMQGIQGEAAFDFDDIAEASLFPITLGGMGCGEEQGQMLC